MFPGLIVICGATATGKSSLAIALAQTIPAIILSADSRQIYRDFTIGTAKPTWEQQQLVPHYFIDICCPTEPYTVADYQDQATVLIQKTQNAWLHPATPSSPATSDNSQPVPPLPLLVGGTGLYIKAIVRGMTIPKVPPQPALRQALASLGQPQCYAMLHQVDPQVTQRIHAHDVVRTLRALEVFYVIGKPISTLQTEHPPTYPILQIGLDCDPEVLKQRIVDRTHHMLELGLVDEVQGLCHRYGTDLPLLNTLGYREIKHYLAGDCSLSAAETKIVQHTRQFAKRQRTWFRADPTIQWFDANATNLLDQVHRYIHDYWRSQGYSSKVSP